MKVEHHDLRVKTKGRGLHDITGDVRWAIEHGGVRDGICVVSVAHTSASLVVQENADPSVLRDLEAWIARVAPEDPNAYEHRAEGVDDMPAHIRAAITRSSESFSIRDKALVLGTWQALYLWEHRRSPHERRLLATLVGVI